MVAALFVMFPSISVVSISTIYHAGGTRSAAAFVKGMIYLLPAWLIYASVVFYLLPRIELTISLSAGVLIYVSSCFLISRIIQVHGSPKS